VGNRNHELSPAEHTDDSATVTKPNPVGIGQLRFNFHWENRMITKPETKKPKVKTPEAEGFIPPDGFITAKELAGRLKLRNHRTLIYRLKEAGIPVGEICGQHLVQCSELEKLFCKD
jgi:hypothetical protein